MEWIFIVLGPLVVLALFLLVMASGGMFGQHKWAQIADELGLELQAGLMPTSMRIEGDYFGADVCVYVVRESTVVERGRFFTIFEATVGGRALIERREYQLVTSLEQFEACLDDVSRRAKREARRR